MKQRPTQTSLEELRRHQLSMTPGALDGRIGEARPIRGEENFSSSGNEELVDAAGETTQRIRFFNQTSLAESSSISVRLNYSPIAHSKHVYVNGAYLDQSYWTYANGFVNITSGLLSGDVVTVEYAHTNELVEAD